MKRILTIVCSIATLLACVAPAWGQSPSTEGRDFWVTFMRAADNSPTDLKLTFSAKTTCTVLVENPTTGFSQQVTVNAGTAYEMGGLGNQDCYVGDNETERVTSRALHITSTADISVFAGNYRDKSFDATNVLPSAACLDEYLIQTYPASDHENKPQGTHFAIVALEDNVVVDYELTAKTNGNKTGSQATQNLMKGQVWYVWTGKTEGNASDLSGTRVKARNGKKIAVFQGAPHTNIPFSVRDRDHIYSQAMPIAYWGSEFVLTASRKHLRDKYCVMAINDGTEVYINNEDGEPELVYTFDFSQNPKHYWEFEIGRYEAYCADKAGESPHHGQLPPPLIVDSSCYLTTSCPAGVHLFMVSNRYDNYTPTVNSDTLVSDPAMLWISPAEQVIKEINFATYKTQQAKFHFVNIVTATSNVPTMTLSGKGNIASYFHPVMGNPSYSFARIEIPHGSYNLKGNMGFLAHVYGYGERESYAYSCGSSTVQRSINFSGEHVMVDSTSISIGCVGSEMDFHLNIGSNDYSSVIWHYGDGTSVRLTGAGADATTHTYDTPGLYELRATATYENRCGSSAGTYTDNVRIYFRIDDLDTVAPVGKHECRVADELPSPAHPLDYEYLGAHYSITTLDTIIYEDMGDACYGTCHPRHLTFGLATEQLIKDVVAKDEYTVEGKTYYEDVEDDYIKLKQKNHLGCDSLVHIQNLTIVSCLHMGDVHAEYECPTDEHPARIAIRYKKNAGGKFVNAELLLSKSATEGLPLDIDAVNSESGFLYLDLKQHPLKVQHYNAVLRVEDTGCDTTLLYDVPFDMMYSSEIFKIKFGNTMAVYNSSYNYNPGEKDPENGYVFIGYQWYKDGEPLHDEPGMYRGTNSSILYSLYGDFLPGEYTVMLTRDGEAPLFACPQTVIGLEEWEEEEEPQQASKVIIDQHIYFRLQDKLYDVYGNVVQTNVVIR